MQHALEADHVAALAAMSSGGTTRRSLLLRGTLWGLGHTLTLLLICGTLLIVGGTISPRVQSRLELLVGAMVMALGGQLLYRLWRQRLHAHEHGRVGLRRALLVGMVHGCAGSGGLMVLAAAAGSVLGSMGYVVAFGVGSVVGMATLSLVASYPLGRLERDTSRAGNLAMGAVGCLAVAIGAWIFGESWVVLR